MSWIELTDKRGRGSKVFQASSDVARHSLDSQCATAWHYGSDMAEVDLTPDRVLTGGHDGWRVTQNGWHYFLGQPNGLPDGFVGFGGRQGEKWLLFRLLRVGYLHWPTRAWDDIGGSPDYDRANLSQQTNETTINTTGETIPVETVATWSDIWNTPGGGALDASWKIDGNRLKEEITINQAARTWIGANRPPATAPDETYFSFVFRLGSAPDVNNIEMDLSYLPRWLKNGVLQDTEGDFDDDGTAGIEVQNALQEFLFFLPISEAYVRGAPPTENIKLRKRIYKDGANYFLLVGAKVSDLAELSAGDIVFDPTLDEDVAASGDDGEWYGGSTFNNNNASTEIGDFLGRNNACFSRYTGVTIPNGSTIGVAYVDVYEAGNDSGTTVNVDITGDDSSNPSAYADYAAASGATGTTAATTWTVPAFDGSGSTRSDSIVGVIQELENSYDYSGGSALIIRIQNNGTTNNAFRQTWQYDNSAATAMDLHIEYTAGAAEGMAIAIATRHMATLRGE